MSRVTLLSTGDKKEWLEILGRFDLKDPHYLPGYLEAYEKESNRESFVHFGGQGMLFVYGDSRNFIIYPFFKRSIADLPFSEPSTDGLFDIVSPYGFGGPLAQIEDETISKELWRGFFDRFDDFCKQSNIVSEFCRLHPMFENHKPVARFSQGVTQQLGQIVYVDLTRSEEEIFAAMAKPHRRRVRRALENPHLSFCLDRKENHPQYFFHLYTQRMQTHRAHNKYFYSLDLFQAAFQSLGEHLGFPHVTYRGEIISGLLALRYGDLVHSWQSASNSDYFHLYPDILLMYSSFVQSKKEGFKYHILGGGLSSGQDSLFTFKAGFSKSFKDFYVFKKIHLKKEYERLVELQSKYGGEIPEDFFPRYRLP